MDTVSTARPHRSRLLRGGWRAAVKLVAVAAIAYQGLIPAGYMLGTRADFAVGTPVVACPAQGEVPSVLAPQHHQHHHHDGAGGAGVHHADSCAFAVAASAALPSTVIALRVVAAPPIAPDTRGDIAARHAEILLPPVRGPPVIA